MDSIEEPIQDESPGMNINYTTHNLFTPKYLILFIVRKLVK